MLAIANEFLLPWDDALIGESTYIKKAGYHKAVEIRLSTILGAGRGMFALENIRKNDCIRSLPLISFDEQKKQYPFETQQHLPLIALGNIIKIPTEAALLSLVRFFEKKSRNVVNPVFIRDFIATYHFAKVDGKEGLADELGCDKFMHLGYPPMCVNHMPGIAGNVRIVYNVDNQKYEYLANSPISAGQELFFDYEKFQPGTNMLIKPWYLKWLKAHNVTSIIDLVDS